MSEITELSRLLLGAYALKDTHTLSADEIYQLAAGGIAESEVAEGLRGLVEAGYAEVQSDGNHRLTRDGIQASLKLQEALSRRSD